MSFSEIVVLIIFFFGLVSLGLFVHEGVHWLQFPGNNKICFFTDNGMGELQSETGELYYLSEHEQLVKEAEAYGAQTLISVIGIIFFCKALWNSNTWN